MFFFAQKKIVVSGNMAKKYGRQVGFF